VFPWPELRQELSVQPGPRASRGSPTFTLHDPVSHRFFRLGWQEMEILSRWHLGNAQAILDDIAQKTTLAPAEEDIKALAAFLAQNNLVTATNPADSLRLLEMKRRQKLSPFRFMVRNYLFLRIPLFRPDAFLERTVHLVRPFFTALALWVIGIAALLGLFLIVRNLSFFLREMEILFSLRGAIMVFVAIGLSKALHELGHAYAAKLAGLHVPAMGVALMCFYPVLWTDTTEAWKCNSRKDRLIIGCAGVGAELALAAVASACWVILPPGILRDMALTLAGTTWVTTLAINANPFMRYDAYYIASDFFEMPMLQHRSFALARWHLRRAMLGLQVAPPEHLAPGAELAAILFAYCTWVYRLFLFLGIAAMVYFMFFKALGILLFLVEIIWFVLLPVAKELREWWKLRGEARLTPYNAVALALFVAFFIPWHSTVTAPAILNSEQTFAVHAPAGGQIDFDLPAVGTLIRRGDTLARLHSPELEYSLTMARSRIRDIEYRLANSGVASELWQQYASLRQELEGVMQEMQTLEYRQSRLHITAPFDGEIKARALSLHQGQWVADKEPLAILAGGATIVDAFVTEDDLPRLTIGDSGAFHSSSGHPDPIPVTVLSISPGAVRQLPRPSLASVHGGSLPARQDAEGNLWPERSVFLVRCAVENAAATSIELTGTVSLHGTSQSLAGRVFTLGKRLVIRESGVN